MKTKINPNLAEASDLVELPGIGPKLAERIIANRPYFSINELQRVQGIGSTNIAQWLDEMTLDADFDETDIPVLDPEEKRGDFLVFKKPEEEDEKEMTPVEKGQSIADEVPPTSSDMFEIPVEDTESKTIPLQDETRKESKDNFTREQVLLIVGGGSLLSFILAVALMLGLLTGLNQGRLRFASPADLSALSLSVDSLTSRLTTQESDLEALRSRVDTLETLDERMTVAEGNINTLTDDINALTSDVDALKEEVAMLNSDVDELQTQIITFTSFFESLRDIFNQFFPAQGGGDD